MVAEPYGNHLGVSTPGIEAEGARTGGGVERRHARIAPWPKL
jgi:hypothetical protein